MAESSGGGNPIQKYQEQIRQGQIGMTGLLETIRIETENAVAAATAPDQFVPGTTKTKEVLLAEQNAKLESQNKVAKIAKAANFDELSVTLGQDLALLANQQRALTQKIAEDSSVSLFDDPLLAIANAFTLPWDQQALDAVEQKLTVTKKSMDAINSHVQQSAKTVDAIEESLTAEGIASTSRALDNMFKTKAAAARLEAAKTNADGIKSALELDARGAQAYLQQVQLRNSEEDRAMARERHGLAVKEYNIRLQKLDDEKAAEGIQLSLANAALVAEGKNPLDINRFKMFKASSADFLDSLIRKGMQLQVDGRQNYTHGATIGDRFQWQNTIGWKPELPQQETVMRWQLEARNAAVAGATGTGKDKTMQANANADAAFAARFRTEQLAITEGSPFKAPAYAVFDKRAPHISANPIWQKYIKPVIADERTAAQSVDEKVILNAAVTAVANREVSSAQASLFIKQLFSQAVALNNEALQFKKIAGYAQDRYGVTIKSGWIGAETYDFTDDVQIARAIAKQLVSKMVPVTLGNVRESATTTGRISPLTPSGAASGIEEAAALYAQGSVYGRSQGAADAARLINAAEDK